MEKKPLQGGDTGRPDGLGGQRLIRPYTNSIPTLRNLAGYALSVNQLRGPAHANGSIGDYLAWVPTV